MGRGEGGSRRREYTLQLRLTLIVVRKPTQFCKAIFLQLKIQFKKNIAVNVPLLLT